MSRKCIEIDASPLEWTGERLLPGVGGFVEAEHLHRYAMATQFAEDKDVLDIACGEGYGTNLLAKGARFVAGVDIAPEVISHARRKYAAVNVEFREGSCSAIPYPEGSFDLVVSFETIEHHDQHAEMMREVKRVLRSNGLLILSSPDKRVYSRLPGYPNQFHVRELDGEEFKALLASYFRHVVILGQQAGFGSVIAPLDRYPNGTGFTLFRGDANNITANPSAVDSTYLLAMASDIDPPRSNASYWEASDSLANTMLAPRRALPSDTASSSDTEPTRRQYGHYRLGDEIDFRLGGNAPLYQQQGWDQPTTGGTWMIAPRAFLRIAFVDKPANLSGLRIEMTAQGVVGPSNPETQAELWINGRLLEPFSIKEQQTILWAFQADAGSIDNGLVLLELRVINPVAPQTLGLSEDARELGLLLARLRITDQFV